MEQRLQTAIKAAVEAGKAIMQVYKSDDFGVEAKADSSPLTLADKAAHDIIEGYLLKTNIPILSEEGMHEKYETRKHWDQLWIVDPLDGTKEFVKKTGEFTINIALIQNNYPVAGVVFVPVTGELFYASADKGSFKVALHKDWLNQNDINIVNAQKLPLANQQKESLKPNKKLRIVASVSHRSKETNQFIQQLEEKYGQADVVAVGSSIKLCKIAEGSADIYPRLGPTMEWDIAAGQAIAECAGAYVIDWNTQSRLKYNRHELLNNWFVVSTDKIPQEELLWLMG